MKPFPLASKRAAYYEATDYLQQYPLDAASKDALECLDTAYRALAAVMFNFVPSSGHMGGSISSGRFVSHLIYKEMAYDLASPNRPEADIISYAAGHKALGMYALWALRDECARIAKPELLPKDVKNRLRLEDLLGFRHNKVQGTPLFVKFQAKPLGGHPEPSVPFVRVTTGASGVGDGSSVGLAIAAADVYGENGPVVHIIEGEGGLTAGRVSEALATAATAQIKNAVFHLDWNEASIETNQVTADGKTPGDYVQWTPCELFYIHDFNVIFVADGMDFAQIHAAQELLKTIPNHQPTAVVYRTVKGWKYGLEGKAAHGAGHKFCSPEFYAALAEFEEKFGEKFPAFEGDNTPENIEKHYWAFLETFRRGLEKHPQLCALLAKQLQERQSALENAGRKERPGAPDAQVLFTGQDPENAPAAFTFTPGDSHTTRGVLGDVLGYLNKESNGALMTASADLYGSTNAGNAAKPFAKGFFNAVSNPLSRSLAAGGICEDGMSAVCSGISAFGKHAGVASSYGAFVAFEHVAARLYAIGCQALKEAGQKTNSLILFNGHASLPTGEDGPTHADPQSLQLLQDNFPQGACITATPLEVDEIWPLVTKSLSLRPAVFAPFVVRPSQKLADRAALGMDPACACLKGVYYLHRAKRPDAGAVFVQGAGIGKVVTDGVLPRLKEENLDVNILYVSSRELFELLPEEEREVLVPARLRRVGMGLTDFTLPTMHAWLLSEKGRRHTLYPFKHSGYLGSAGAANIYKEAGMDAAGVIAAIKAYMNDLESSAW